MTRITITILKLCEALKVDLFNELLGRLIKGDEVEIPLYSFTRGSCEERGISMKVPTGEPIIIEGIHGLNERLTWSIPPEQKFKIYISALTQLNTDYSNGIPTTESRLSRRIVSALEPESTMLGKHSSLHLRI